MNRTVRINVNSAYETDYGTLGQNSRQDTFGKAVCIYQNLVAEAPG